MCLPAVVHLSRGFWDDTRYRTEFEKLPFVMRQFTLMTVWCRISTVELRDCNMREQDAERLAGVLGRCAALAHLDLRCNYHFGEVGTERLTGVLGQCRELVHLNLSGNQFGVVGARLEGVLVQCPVMVHLDLRYHGICVAGTDTFAGVLTQCPALAHLNLSVNHIGDAGVERLAGVLAQ